jgi:aminoglycoside phosphotransferase (APT) family kinase protein
VSPTDAVATADVLPPGVGAWLAERCGRVTHVERAAARRQAWSIDAEDGDGAARALFLRTAVAGDPANDPDALWREARVVEAVRRLDLPVPAVRAADRDLGAVLFDRVAGGWELHLQPAARQDVVYADYVRLLARLHQSDVDSLDLGDVLTAPASGHAAALGPVEAAMRDRPRGEHDDPLEAFAMDWLRRHVPEGPGRTTLVHGDAGVGNFLFVEDRVTALLDWEWAHLGDPMEDLAALNIHASFFPSGSGPAMLAGYAAAGGAPVDLARIRFFRVENMLRSVIVLRAITARLDVRDPVALNTAYRLLCERFLGDCLADAMGVSPPAVALAPVDASGPSLHGFVAECLRDLVVPALDAGWARDQASAAARLVDHLDAERRLRPACDELEVHDLGSVLGEAPPDVATGRARLVRALSTWDGAHDEAVVRYLTARSRREEQLASCLMDGLPRVQLRPLT